MGRSLKGKELGVGISQRKDGMFQARYTDRFGRRKTIYDKKLSKIRKRLRQVQCEEDREPDAAADVMTLDEWFDIWIGTFKRNCRNSSMITYRTHYNLIKADLGWRSLSSLNLINMQECLNRLRNDNKRTNSKKLLVDMLSKAVDSDLLTKNIATRLNTIVTRERKAERRVLTIPETEIFLEMAEGTTYYDLYIVALETGMRIGEICGLQWDDIDFEQKKLIVDRTLCYFSVYGVHSFEMHDTKTMSGHRTIPLTTGALCALKRQRAWKNKIVEDGKIPPKGYEDLVFVTSRNGPLSQQTVQGGIDKVIKRIRKTQEFERFTPHTFRHTFATRAIERGLHPKTLQKILGHSKIQMTLDLYCHVTEDTLFEEMMKFDGLV